MSIEGYFIVALAVIDLVLVVWKVRTDNAHQRTIERVQDAQTAALKRVADALEQRLRPGPPTVSPNSIDVEWHPRGRDHIVRVLNRGPGAIDLVDIAVLEDPNLLVPPVLPPNPLSLSPGRHHDVVAAASLATPRFLTARVTWVDQAGTHQEDHQVSTL